MAISTENTKLGKIHNISLRPVADCGSCKHCRDNCYALKAYRQYPDTRASWDANSKMARLDPLIYEAMLNAWLMTRKPRFFRLFVSGDFLSQAHVDIHVRVARRNPGTKFLAFTKMHDLDFSAAPSNMSIVLSRWIGDTEPANPLGLRMAWYQDGTETRVPDNAIPCSDKCDKCFKCWSLKSIGRDIVLNAH